MIGHMLANVLLYIEGKFASLLYMYYIYHYTINNLTDYEYKCTMFFK